MTEAMIRDRLMAQRAGLPSPFPDAGVRAILASMLSGLGREPA